MDQRRTIPVNARHRKTLQAIFDRPTSGSVRFADIEALVLALGGQVREGAGSRIALQLDESVKHAHRPHPGKKRRSTKSKRSALGYLNRGLSHDTKYPELSRLRRQRRA